MYLRPSDIHYSQDSINIFFDKRSLHSGIRIGQTLDDICEGRCSIQTIPTISVVKMDNKWVTADNRRLWVFKQLERLGRCEQIYVYETCHIPPSKMTSYNGGETVNVRGNPGGVWHRKSSRSVARNAPRSSSVTGITHVRKYQISYQSDNVCSTGHERQSFIRQPLYNSNDYYPSIASEVTERGNQMPWLNISTSSKPSRSTDNSDAKKYNPFSSSEDETGYITEVERPKGLAKRQPIPATRVRREYNNIPYTSRDSTGDSFGCCCIIL